MRLLVIGKIDSQVAAASTIARNQGASVNHAPDSETALALLRSGKGADILLVDVRLDIRELITRLNQERIAVPVVAFGIQADSQAAVNAIKAGAKEYLPLPPDEDMIAAVLAAISNDGVNLVYASDAMKNVMALVERIAPSDASVLITGESGTGKEVIARHIHEKSRRKDQPFISLNCAAIPDSLLESELFGHEKGAFTGALHRRIGKFEEANHGTLLLDEISEMDIRLQAKLLRAIQEREIDRVGGTQPVKLDLRILATSNRNLKEAVAKGAFREDLFFRLNVIEIKIPPLRERRDDIKLLAEHFAIKYAEANGLPTLPLGETALQKMLRYPWPGNVRELENAIHRAVLLSIGGEISEEALRLEGEVAGAAAASSSSGGTLVGRTVENVEREMILQTLDHCLGNRTHAATILGISIRTLRNKLNQYSEQTGTG